MRKGWEKHMLHFECDYACGAAQPVLDALVRTNGEQTSGYGEDPHCERARALIRQLCRRPDAYERSAGAGQRQGKAAPRRVHLEESGGAPAGEHEVLTVKKREPGVLPGFFLSP